MESISIVSAYMWAFVIFGVFFLVAVVSANMIMFRPGNTGTTARRIWFWVLCLLTGIVSFITNYSIAGNIEVPSAKNNYIMHASIASGVAVVAFILVGFVISKIFSNSKVGTWF